MNASAPCPVCGSRECHWLSTTNEWRNYCPPCDIRFNDNGEVRPTDQHKVNRGPTVSA